MDNQLALFETLDRELEKQIADTRATQMLPATCHFCGEQSANSYLAQNGHGIVFNGWCMKALVWHTGNKSALWTDKAGWLQSKGIDPALSRFDESHWNHKNVGKHYSRHYGDCY